MFSFDLLDHHSILTIVGSKEDRKIL